MINVSNEFKQLMEQRRDFQEAAEVTLLDGTVLTFGEDDFTVGNNGYTDGAGDSTLPLGVVVGRSIQIEIWNGDEHLDQYDFFGATVKLSLTFQLSSTVERINVGTFYVITPETRGETVIITASDASYRTDKPYETALTFPAPARTVFRDACDRCGIPYETTSFPNDGFSMAKPPAEKDLTFRQVIGYVAMIAGGNARINRQGKMEILSYDFAGIRAKSNPKRHDLADWSQPPKVDTNDIKITGVKTTVTVETEDGDSEEREVLCGNEGYVIFVDNPLFAGREQEAVNLIGAVLVGAQFRKFSGDYLAYPLAEFMDPVKITDRRGRIYYSIITDIDFAWFGRTAISNSAESAARMGSTYTSPESKAVIKMRQLVAMERSARETAVATLDEMVRNAGGMYSTDEDQPDGSVVHYLHDKPTLSESTNVIKVTSEAIGFSTDGGETYPFGLEISGDVVTRILSATGINAEWIKVGNKTIVQYLDDDLNERAQSGEFDGPAGNGIKSTVDYYLVSDRAAGVSTDEPGWSRFPQQMTPERPYLWSYRVSAYAAGDESATETVSGNPAVFTNPFDPVPLEQVTVDLVPEQSGGGDPSPDNVRPIAARTGAAVTRAGRNLLDLSTVRRYAANTEVFYDADAQTVRVTGTNRYACGYCVVSLKAGVPYTFTAEAEVASGVATIGLRRMDNSRLIVSSRSGAQGGSHTFSYTPDVDGTFRFCLFGNYETDSADVTYSRVQMETGSAAAYEPYRGNTYALPFDSDWAVCGGTLDVTAGELTVTKICKTLTGGENFFLSTSGGYRRFLWKLTGAGGWPEAARIQDALSSHFTRKGSETQTTDVWGVFRVSVDNYLVLVDNDAVMENAAALKRWLAAEYAAGTPVQICYTLASPVTYPVTPTEIPSLTGQNTVLSDAGIVRVKYFTDAHATYPVLIGALGRDGVGVLAVVPEYYLSTSEDDLIGGFWSETVPAISEDTWLWTRSRVKYSEGNPTYTEPYCLTRPAAELIAPAINRVTEAYQTYATQLVMEEREARIAASSEYVERSAYEEYQRTMATELKLRDDQIAMSATREEVTQVVNDMGELQEYRETLGKYLTLDAVLGLVLSALGSEVRTIISNTAWQLEASGKILQQVDAEHGAQFSALVLRALTEGDIPCMQLGNLKISVMADGSLIGRRT